MLSDGRLAGESSLLLIASLAASSLLLLATQIAPPVEPLRGTLSSDRGVSSECPLCARLGETEAGLFCPVLR